MSRRPPHARPQERPHSWTMLAVLTVALGETLFPLAEARDAPAQEGCPSDLRTIALAAEDVLRTLDKSPHYTQGLAIHDGRLYEGAGMFGHSGVHVSALDGTNAAALTGLDQSLFGEGLAILGGQAFQLTWKAQRAYVYDVQSDGTLHAAKNATRHYAGEGWGLASYGDQLVMSDGSPTLRVLTPASFAVTREITVRAGKRPVPGLNELEVVGDQVLANLYGPSFIVAIDLDTGCVRAALDATPLARAVQASLPQGSAAICGSFGCTASDYVLNGIAYDKRRDELYLTGKNWPRVFVLANPLSQDATDDAS